MSDRRPLGRLARGALLAACMSVGARDARALQAGAPLHQTRLENGLDVVVAEHRGAPLATVLVAVRNGAFTQDANDEGLAHLYEHLLFRAYPGAAGAFWRAVNDMNGRANGTTSEEVVTYFVEVPSKKTPDAIRLLSRLVREARFSDGDVNDERPIVLDELERHASDPSDAFRRATGASYAPFLERGVAVAGVYASTSDPEEVVRIMQETIMALAAARWTQNAFGGSREEMALNELRASIGAAEQADRLGGAELYYGDWHRAGADMHRLRGVTGLQVSNAAQLYFQRVSYAYIGDPKLIKLDR